ncbi:MAG TPA: ankyrin repeat domain-containing protein [Pyrinomonadaceae bacterium]|nr:ankyrin repeat domain-containing protein [Pyrinomonadaceae bacterium]
MKIKFLAVCLCLVSMSYGAQEKTGARAQKSAGEIVDQKLIACVKAGDADCVAKALAAGAKANASNAEGRAALILAAEGKSAEVVRLLLEAGAEVNRNWGGEGSPLCRAALFGRKEITGMLLTKRAKVNVVCDSDHGDTPLLEALRGMMLADMPGELRETFVQAGDESYKAGEAAEKLREALSASSADFLAVARALLARGADVNVVATCDAGETALMYAAMSGNAELMKELLARGADVNKGVPVLAWMVQYERELERGKSLALPAMSKNQAAMLAWSERTKAAREEIKRLLKAAGAKETAEGEEDDSAKTDAETLEEVADAAFRDAIEVDDRKDFARLVDAYAKHPLGAVVLPEALRRTIIYQRTEMFKLLLERGTSPNADRGMANRHPPLQQAAYSGQLEYARMLLDAGADMDKRDENGLTALDAAERQSSSSEEHRAIAELLKARGAKSKGQKP